jgi:hypothetical protein
MGRAPRAGPRPRPPPAGRAEAHAAQHGRDVLRLDTNKALTTAITRYNAQGFQEVPAFNDEPYAHHWFEKRIASVGAAEAPQRTDVPNNTRTNRWSRTLSGVVMALVGVGVLAANIVEVVHGDRASAGHGHGLTVR